MEYQNWHRLLTNLALVVTCGILFLGTARAAQTLPETMLTGAAFTIDDTKERSFVPGATVLLQPAAGDTVRVTTDEQGRFTAPVAPGQYRVSFFEVAGMEATPVDVDVHRENRRPWISS